MISADQPDPSGQIRILRDTMYPIGLNCMIPAGGPGTSGHTDVLPYTLPTKILNGMIPADRPEPSGHTSILPNTLSAKRLPGRLSAICPPRPVHIAGPDNFVSAKVTRETSFSDCPKLPVPADRPDGNPVAGPDGSEFADRPDLNAHATTAGQPFPDVNVSLVKSAGLPGLCSHTGEPGRCKSTAERAMKPVQKPRAEGPYNIKRTAPWDKTNFTDGAKNAAVPSFTARRARLGSAATAAGPLHPNSSYEAILLVQTVMPGSGGPAGLPCISTPASRPAFF